MNERKSDYDDVKSGNFYKVNWKKIHHLDELSSGEEKREEGRIINLSIVIHQVIEKRLKQMCAITLTTLHLAYSKHFWSLMNPKNLICTTGQSTTYTVDQKRLVG